MVRILWTVGYGMSLLESPLWYEFIVTYNPDLGVVGIENTHLVTDDGLETLTISEEDIVIV